MKNLVSIFFLIILVGCSNTEKAEIPQEKMVDVLYDLTVSSSARSTANRRDTVQYVVDYKQILKKHGIDSLKFIKAQKVYQQDPDVYTVIYDSVQKRLQKKLEEVRATKVDSTEEKLNPVINVKELKALRRNK
ncbi:MAG: DUF4296 domain-containing protein [Myroides sp.]